MCSSLVIDLSKAGKPYGHVAYTRHTKAGKLVQVRARGVKPAADEGELESLFPPSPQPVQPMIRPVLKRRRTGEYKTHKVSSVEISGTGFTLDVEQVAKPEEAVDSIMKAVNGLREVFNLDPEKHPCRIVVRDFYDHVNARYWPTDNTITIDSRKGRGSFYHEFGHFLDYKAINKPSYNSHIENVCKLVAVYDRRLDERNRLMRDTNRAEKNGHVSTVTRYEALLGELDKTLDTLEDSLLPYKPVVEWVRAVEKCGILKRLKPSQSPNTTPKHLEYLREPAEIFARFFNDWCYTRLIEKHPREFVSEKYAIVYSGRNRNVRDFNGKVLLSSAADFTEKEFAVLRPAFENMMTKKLLKAVRMVLSKSLLTENPHRQKDYAHIASVRDGRAVRSTRHRGSGVFNGEEWRLRTRDAMLDAATEAVGHDNIGGALQWLEERHLELPTIESSANKISAAQWLHRNGRTAFALGLHLIGLNGETVASMSELPEMDKAFVIRVGDLQKARTRGAVASTISGGKHGKIVRLLDGTVWKLEAKHEARLGEILQYYAKNNIPYRHVPPGTKVGRVEVEQLTDDAKRSSVAMPKVKVVDAPVPQEVVEAAQKRPHIAAVEVLRDRVANWTRPAGYERTLDPRDRAELAKLITKRRSIGAGWRKFKSDIENLKELKPKGYKGQIRELRLEESKAAVTYAEAGRRIRSILGSSHPTKGGGFREITHEEAAIIDALPHADLGFNPNEKPMSYLLSLGWNNKDQNGNNKFSKREFDALLFEYERFINRTVGQIVRKFEPSLLAEGGQVREEEGGWSKRYRRQKFKDWVNEAKTILYDMSAKYDSTGSPSESNNFALYAHTFLPRKLLDVVKDDIGVDTKESVFLSDLDSMPERGGRLMTPHARIETPEQALYRRELETGASKLFSNILSPLEAAVVASRLNFESSTKNVYEKKNQKIDVGAVMGWLAVRDNVIANLEDFIKDETQRREAATVVAKMKEPTLIGIFEGALAKLRDNSSELESSEKKTLAELARLKTLYLEGIRHETYDQNESFGRLLVHPEKGEVVDEHARKRVSIRPLIKDTKVLRFWQRHPELADQVRIDAFYTDMPGLERSRKVEIDEIKAHLYYRMLDDIRRHQVKTLQRDIVNHVEPPDTTYHGGKVRMPQAHYQALMQFALDEKLSSKGSTTKSFVILDCAAAIDGLMAECQLWDLAQGV